MNNLQKQYKEKIVPALMEKFGYKNYLQVPTINKVVLNVGIGSGLKDKGYLELVKKNLQNISGQKSVETLSRKSISNFKVREGMVVGVKVTLRGVRMWDFLERLIKVTLPRIRDFRGISPEAFDRRGSYSLGFKDNTAFPEIEGEELEKTHGLEVTITTTAKNKKEGLELLTEMGFPFRKEEIK
ncbi:50S ribosomal protein L5 [Patescibacteria group bacterium]|nr:50S ribosomal protein L5 [Patescibacteria group bacterium]